MIAYGRTRSCRGVEADFESGAGAGVAAGSDSDSDSGLSLSPGLVARRSTPALALAHRLAYDDDHHRSHLSLIQPPVFEVAAAAAVAVATDDCEKGSDYGGGGDGHSHLTSFSSG